MNKLPDIISNVNIITIETMGKYFFIAQSIDQIERLMSYDDAQNLMEDDDFDISLRKQSQRNGNLRWSPAKIEPINKINERNQSLWSSLQQ